MSERELTYTPAQIQHPQTLMNGEVMLLEGDVADKIQFGDKAKGWEGDSRLMLAWNGKEQRIELWRKERGGEYSMVMRGKPGKRVVDMGIIDFLILHDNRRGFDVKKYVDEHNAKVDAANPAHEKVRAATEKLGWALKRDHGISSKPISLSGTKPVKK